MTRKKRVDQLVKRLETQSIVIDDFVFCSCNVCAQCRDNQQEEALYRTHSPAATQGRTTNAEYYELLQKEGLRDKHTSFEQSFYIGGHKW